jgi:hypothetical protein
MSSAIAMPHGEQKEIRNGTESPPAAVAVAASEVFQEHRNEHDR